MSIPINREYCSERLLDHVNSTWYLQPKFLNQYGPKPGDCVVLLVEEERKVWYWLHKKNGWELAFMPRSYRANRGEFIRPGSTPLKICKDGSVKVGNDVSELLIVRNDEDIKRYRHLA